MEEKVKEPILIIEDAEKAEVPIDDQPLDQHPDGEEGNDDREVENKQPTKKPIVREILSYILIIVFAYVFANVISNYVTTPVTVEGSSMDPTLKNDDYLILWRLGKLKRFDIVVFDPSDNVTINEEKYYIKRLIGLPGDYIEYTDGQLYINGEAIEEPYLEGKTYPRNYTLEDVCNGGVDGRHTENSVNCLIDGKVQIPEGYYFVLGDNRETNDYGREYSYDSKNFGLVKEENFIGKAIFRLRGGFGPIK